MMENITQSFKTEYALSVDSPSVFCTSDNYVSSVNYLINSLQTEGLYEFSLSALSNTEGKLNLEEFCNIINQIYKLSNITQQQSSQIKDFTDKIGKLTVDNNSLTSKLSDLKESLMEKDRLNYELTSRKQLIEKEFSNYEKKSKSMINDLEKKNNQISNRDKQYRHEMRKYELEAEKFKEKINKLITEQNKPAIKGLTVEISNNLNKTNASRAKWTGTFLPEKELLTQQINNLQERLTETQNENNAVKNTITELESKLNTVLQQKEPNSVTINGANKEIEYTPEQLELLQVDYTPTPCTIPFQYYGNDFQTKFNEKLALLKVKLQENAKQNAELLAHNKAAKQEGNKDELIKQLQFKIKSQIELLAEQEQLIAMNLFNQKDFSTELSEDRRLSDQAELQMIQHKIQQEKLKQMEINAKLEADRVNLEEEKKQFRLTQTKFFLKYAGQTGQTNNTKSNTVSLASKLTKSKGSNESVEQDKENVNTVNRQLVTKSDNNATKDKLTLSINTDEFDNVSPQTPNSTRNNFMYQLAALGPTPQLSPCQTDYFQSPHANKTNQLGLFSNMDSSFGSPIASPIVGHSNKYGLESVHENLEESLTPSKQ